MNRPIAAVLLLTALWVLGSTWYYDCQIKRACGPTSTAEVQATAPVPAPPLSRQPLAAAAAPVLTVHFGRQSTDMLLPTEADATVQTLLKAAAAGRKLVITGHSDARGASALKASLSVQRAQILRDWLLSRGLPATAIRAVESREDHEPIADNATAAGRAENRRAIATLAPLAPQE